MEKDSSYLLSYPTLYLYLLYFTIPYLISHLTKERMGRKQEKRSKYGADSVRIDLISHHVKTSKHKKTSDTIKKEAKKVK